MQVIYLANDGTIFYSEEECEVYEEKKKIADMNLQSRFFDRNGNLMDITNLDNCIENGWYMEIADMTEAKFIADYAKREVGTTLFTTCPCIGRFYWDDNTDKWRNIEELYAIYKEKLKVFEG